MFEMSVWYTKRLVEEGPRRKASWGIGRNLVSKKKKLAKQRLCDWSRSDIEKGAETLAEITSSPAFACRKCARVANEQRLVCKPMALPTLRKQRNVG